MSLTISAKGALRELAYISGVSARLARVQARCRILSFHGVTAAHVSAFDDQLRYLQQHFTICRLHDLFNRVPSNAVALTFDDGLKNNVTTVYPLLQKYAIPATFYICPGLIGTGAWLWNHEARQRLSSMVQDDRVSTARLLGIAPSSPDAIVEYLKTLPLDDRCAAEVNIRARSAEYVPEPYESEAFDLAGWADLARLDDRLVTIGCHSMSHPILTRLQDCALVREIVDSRRLLETNLGRPVLDFSYPNGAFDARIVSLVRQTYRTAVTMESAAVRPEQDRWLLPRIPSATTVSLLAWRMHRPPDTRRIDLEAGPPQASPADGSVV